jgi:NADPH-dependent curcumin reductase CurA
MGLPGWTAHVGLFDLCAPMSGETIVVSSASGAVGGFVGQLARGIGLKVVGIAGGTEKCAYAVSELGYHACVDHKAPDFATQLAGACPDGIDIDFENVGGVILDTVWPLLNNNARVLVCGLMAQYNLTSPYPGPDLTRLLKSRTVVRGFIISDHLKRIPDAIKQMAERIAGGKISYRTDITEGLENAPGAFIGMLQGRNFGKAIVKIAS